MVMPTALAACSVPDEGDYQSDAADFIVDQLRIDLDVDSEVECQAPASTDVGTSFACSAKTADGDRFEYVATITGDDSIEILGFAPQQAMVLIQREVERELGVPADVSCELPGSTAQGTTFACTAEAGDGFTYDFVAEITPDGVTVELR